MSIAHWFPPDLDSVPDEEGSYYLTPDEEQCECGGIREDSVCPYCTPLPPPAIDELSRAELAHDADVEALLAEGEASSPVASSPSLSVTSHSS